MRRASNSVSASYEANDAPGPPTEKKNTVGQTIALLRFLAAAPYPLGVNAIARELNVAPSSCFRILKQLSEEGYAQFDCTNKCYSLGSAAVMLARRALDPANTFALIQPVLAKFVEETQTSLGFWRRIDGKRIVLAGFIESSHPMRIHMTVGQRLPLFIGAVGRAFAAELKLSDADIAHELSLLRWEAPPRADDYREQVLEYHRLGYTVDSGNFVPGVTTVGTVLTDAVGSVSFGLSAIRISSQIDEQEVLRIGAALARLRQEIHNNWYGNESGRGD